MIYVVFDSDELFFRPGKYFQTLAEAEEVAKHENLKIFSVSKAPKRWVVDGTGWKPHFNHGLGMWIEDRRQYREILKSKGLVEAGNEHHGYKGPEQTSYVDKDMLSYLAQEHQFTDTQLNELATDERRNSDTGSGSTADGV